MGTEAQGEPDTLRFCYGGECFKVCNWLPKCFPSDGRVAAAPTLSECDPMAEIKQFICDGCGIVKGEANHWWMSWQHADEFSVWRWVTSETSTKVFHYCGAACVQKALAKFMDGM